VNRIARRNFFVREDLFNSPGGISSPAKISSEPAEYKVEGSLINMRLHVEVFDLKRHPASLAFFEGGLLQVKDEDRVRQNVARGMQVCLNSTMEPTGSNRMAP